VIWRSVEKLWDDDGNTISCRWGDVGGLMEASEEN
jgi:hypothetical protein